MRISKLHFCTKSPKMYLKYCKNRKSFSISTKTSQFKNSIRWFRRADNGVMNDVITHVRWAWVQA